MNDEAADLPDDVREDRATERRMTGWADFKKFIQERRIDSGGEHFTRDELHERRGTSS